MNALAATWSWFQGKKTILGGAILILVAFLGAFTGKLGLVDAATITGFGISFLGLGSKGNKILAGLAAVSQAGIDLRLGNKAAVVADLKPVAQEVVNEFGCSIPNCPDCAVLAAARSLNEQAKVEVEPAPAPQLVPAALKPAPPLPSGPPPSGDDAMRPGPRRTATAEEWAALQAIAAAAANKGAKS